MPSLIWVFAGRTCHLAGFVMRWLKYCNRKGLRSMKESLFKYGFHHFSPFDPLRTSPDTLLQYMYIKKRFIEPGIAAIADKLEIISCDLNCSANNPSLCKSLLSCRCHRKSKAIICQTDLIQLQWRQHIYSKYRYTLTLSTPGKTFSRRHYKIFLLVLPENRFWYFHANLRQFVRNVYSCFWKKWEKYHQFVVC